MNYFGYKRKDGKVGIRNYIVVISTVQCANNVAIRIAEKAEAIPIVHDFGCMESDTASERTKLGLYGAINNPNVYGVVVVGLGCEQVDAEELYSYSLDLGKDTYKLLVQDFESPLEAIEQGVSYVNSIKENAMKLEREKVDLKNLVVGVQCGGSDWTTAIAGNTAIGVMTDKIISQGGSVLMSEVAGFPGSEHIVAERGKTKEVGKDILDMVKNLREEFYRKNNQTIEDVNPTPGNKKGGITTLVEKSMGNVKKMGSSEIQGIIHLGEEIPYPGLWILDTREQGPDSFVTTAFAMSGANITAFSTGRGSPIGNAIMPLCKITGNPETYKKLNGIMDFNAGRVIEGEEIEKVGDDLFNKILDISNGETTKSEINMNFDYTTPRDF